MSVWKCEHCGGMIGGRTQAVVDDYVAEHRCAGVYRALARRLRDRLVKHRMNNSGRFLERVNREDDDLLAEADRVLGPSNGKGGG